MNMENFNDVVFDEDEFDGIDDQSQNSDINEGNEFVNDSKPSVEPDVDLTAEVLRLKGITDPGKIKFEDETGAIVERDWDSLSRDEQINILADQAPEYADLEDSELQIINSLREQGITLDEYIQSLQPEPEPVKRYDIDDLSDDELFALDLLHKAGTDISDDEIDSALEAAKQNESLFEKTIEGLRKEYIRLQEDEEAKIANERAAQQEAVYNQFANSIMGQIGQLNSFAGQPLQLSNDDVEDLSSFMLDLDDQGLSPFGKAMTDPALFTKAAFWVLNEDKIVEELNKQIQDNYRRGYEQAKLDLSEGPKAKLVFNKPTSQKKITDDVFIDDEDWY